ncbi:speckle-type POZ protein B-like [Leptopilina boulardi]|uniref:speckle-type POZ protein B-like n=1 Tax=Leptopilina boulardi TaxID=63433 RepID=UPI0021F5FDF2|nr:speckle-type POZ protein B-like [Leptopilina boulardi]
MYMCKKKMETTVKNMDNEKNVKKIHNELHDGGVTNFNWIVKNYDNVISSDGVITSNVFSIEGTTPKLKCTIQIDKIDSSYCSSRMKAGDYVHIQIFNVQQLELHLEKMVKIKLTLGVIKKNKIHFKNRCIISKFKYFIDENEIKKSLSANGSLHLNLQIKQLENMKKTTNTTIDNNFQSFFLNNALSDVTFNIDNHNFPAHKIVLSSMSSVFEKMFSHQMKENITNIVVIEEIDGDVFKEMLRYIYMGKIENSKNVAYDLHELANKYDIPKLRLICQQYLENYLTVNNVISILQLADFHNSLNLKKKCIIFIQKHFNEIGSMEAYKNLKHELLLELLFAMNTKCSRAS